MHKQKRTAKQFGFSLVEIIIVIAIIGVLVTLSSVSFTKVRQNSANKTRETQAKTFAASLENFAKYDERTLNCTEITKAPDVTASLLEIEAATISDPDNSAQTRVSCTKNARPATSDSFFVSGLGCPEIRVEYIKSGSSDRGFVTAKGPVSDGQPCISPDLDNL